jgi:hypothetical protein
MSQDAELPDGTLIDPTVQLVDVPPVEGVADTVTLLAVAVPSFLT